MTAALPERKRLLFVDDDADFLAGVRDIFGGMSRGTWEIATATNHSQALACLSQGPVDVVVLDYNMPVMDGLGFLRLLRRTHPGQLAVMLTSRSDDATRRACLENGAALFLEKLLTPQGYEGVFAALDALAHAVPRTGFRGLMQTVGLQDVLQMECLGRKSSILEVFAGSSRGRVYIQEGAIIHAESGGLEGEVALYGLLALRDGEFNLLPFTPPPHSSISGQYEFLLMEAARLRDEGTQMTLPPALSVEAGPTRAPTGTPATVPPTPAGAVRIQEVVLCSGSGELLYEHGCPAVDRVLGLLGQVEQQATQLGDLLPAGHFDRLEILNEHGRTICQIQPHMRLFVHSTTTELPPE